MVKDDYKPYQEDWERDVYIREFIGFVIYNLNMFENNMVKLNKGTASLSKERWMELFLLWMEYKK